MQLQHYCYDGQEVRVVGTPERPEWVAKDVGDILGIVDLHTTLADIPDDEKGRHTVPTPGGPQEMVTLTESGLYRLIFKSRKPNAERFRKWVFSEVLPSIRKTGTYALEIKATTPTEVLLNQAKMMVAALEQLNHVQTVATQAVQVANRVSDEVKQLKAEREEARHDLEHIPLAGEPAKQRTTRSLVVELVRKYAIAKNLEHYVVWTALYRDFKHRYQFDAWQRARNKGKGVKPLDVIEQEGMMEEFYKFVSEKCCPDNVESTNEP